MSCSEVSGYGWAYLLSLTFVTSNQGEDTALTSYSNREEDKNTHFFSNSDRSPIKLSPTDSLGQSEQVV